MKIKYLINQLRELSLPEGEYAVFGGAVMALRDIREAPNIDVIVTNKLWEQLLVGHAPDSEGFIRMRMVKISNWWFAPTRKDISAMIKEAEMIDGIPFVRLEEVRSYKSGLNRDKDRKDVKLIDDYLQNQDGKMSFNLGIDEYRDLLDIFVKKVNELFLDQVLSMVVFGSVSRGKAKGNSDIDTFVFYDEKLVKRDDLVNVFNQIILELRDSKEYKKLSKKEIYPEIYPFYISKVKTKVLPWVCLDSTSDGFILMDKNNFGKNLLRSLKKEVDKSGGRKVNLENKKWCWLIENKQIINNNLKNYMDIKSRAALLFDVSVESIAEAEFSLERGVNNLAIRRSQEAVELCLTGMLAFLGVHYPKDHDQAPLLMNMLKARGFELKDEDEKIKMISIDLSRKRGPALHQEEGFDKVVAEKAVKDAKFVIRTVDKIKKQIG